MPRARNIKPGFFTNEVLAELPPLTRLLFIGLWTEADREGRLEDRPTRLRLRLFPLDEFDINASLDKLAAKGFISRYLADGSWFIQVVAWHKHQRPHVKEKSSTIPAEVLSKHNLGSGEPALIPDTGYLISDTPQPLAGRFAEFWALYPRKDGKAAAEKLYRSQAASPAKAEAIIAALRQQLPGLKARDPQYRPHARTWLSQRRWEDDAVEPEPQGEEYEFEYQKPFPFDKIKAGERGPDFPSLQSLLDDFMEVAKEKIN